MRCVESNGPFHGDEHGAHGPGAGAGRERALPLDVHGREPADASACCRRFVLPPEGIVLEDVERDLLVQALERCHGNRTRAARLLGLNRDQVRYRIHKFGLERLAPEQEEQASGTDSAEGPP